MWGGGLLPSWALGEVRGPEAPSLCQVSPPKPLLIQGGTCLGLSSRGACGEHALGGGGPPPASSLLLAPAPLGSSGSSELWGLKAELSCPQHR